MMVSELSIFGGGLSDQSVRYRSNLKAHPVLLCPSPERLDSQPTAKGTRLNKFSDILFLPAQAIARFPLRSKPPPNLGRQPDRYGPSTTHFSYSFFKSL
tara:strand:- start:1137 stop:1433 length:297 start_codon:yes stop_codon:yes gene_type:complete